MLFIIPVPKKRSGPEVQLLTHLLRSLILREVHRLHHKCQMNCLLMCVSRFSSGKEFPKTSSRNWPTVANIFIYVLAVIPFVMELQIDQFKALTTQIHNNTCTKVILPAVTTPSASNTGFRLASCSAVESGRGCSSVSIVLDRMPSFTYTVSNSKQAAVLVT